MRSNANWKLFSETKNKKKKPKFGNLNLCKINYFKIIMKTYSPIRLKNAIVWDSTELFFAIQKKFYLCETRNCFCFKLKNCKLKTWKILICLFVLLVSTMQLKIKLKKKFPANFKLSFENRKDWQSKIIM